jgi:hypothetical protein
MPFRPALLASGAKCSLVSILRTSIAIAVRLPQLDFPGAAMLPSNGDGAAVPNRFLARFKVAHIERGNQVVSQFQFDSAESP